MGTGNVDVQCSKGMNSCSEVVKMKNGSEEGVTSNFTNDLEQVPYVELRKGFKVCGMLTCVFITQEMCDDKIRICELYGMKQNSQRR